MTERVASSRVREITVDADGLALSGLISEPSRTPPRAVVVAVHGSGMRAGYFDGRAHPGLSLLALGAGLGYTVLALDRPGYGRSAAPCPRGQTLTEQSSTLRAALDWFARRHPVGAGYFLAAHSYGGKLALTTAAEGIGDRLIGLDVSGCGHRYAVSARELPNARKTPAWRLNWGAPRLYPPNTFATSRSLVAAVPERESREALSWPERFPGVASRIRVPVRFTFAEYERWWRHDEDAVNELLAMLAGTRAVVDRQPDAGHNISLGWAARSYHLRVLGFLEQCLARRETAGSLPTVSRPA